MKPDLLLSAPCNRVRSRIRKVRDLEWNVGLLRHGQEAVGNWINVLLIDCPAFVPGHHVFCLRGSDSENKLAERVDGQSPPQNPLNSREPWVVPSVDSSPFYELFQLSLRHYSVAHVKAGVGPNIDRAQLQLLDKPAILLVPIFVLHCPERMGDPLNGVDDWTGEIISRIDLIFGTSFMVRLRLAPVYCRIPHALVWVLHPDFGAKDALKPVLRALFHLAPSPFVLSNRELPRVGFDSIHPLRPHLLDRGVINIGESLIDEFVGVCQDRFKMIGCGRWRFVLYAQGLQVAHDIVYELLALFLRVCVVKAQETFTFPVFGEEVIQQHCLCVTNVEVTGWLRRESCHHFSHDGSRERNVKRSVAFSFLLLRLLRVAL
mmetsp:Transcript_2587/g.5900  ORF Transcript_2587/g.5900 Transcript_2587/m.5900 type:complete len:375 (+) Transcript_2587:785-1909(+)